MTKKRAPQPPSSVSLSHRKRAFLQHYVALCVIGDAATAAGVTRRTTERWRESDKEFSEDFKAAQQSVVEKLEKEAIRRAYEGYDEPVFQGGRLVGTVRKFSDTLLIFLLNGAAPAKYRQRHEVTGADGGPVKIDMDDARERLLTKLQEKAPA